MCRVGVSLLYCMPTRKCIRRCPSVHTKYYNSIWHAILDLHHSSNLALFSIFLFAFFSLSISVGILFMSLVVGYSESEAKICVTHKFESVDVSVLDGEHLIELTGV